MLNLNLSSWKTRFPDESTELYQSRCFEELNERENFIQISIRKILGGIFSLKLCIVTNNCDANYDMTRDTLEKNNGNTIM